MSTEPSSLPWLVRLLSLAVPAAERDAWRREWAAEWRHCRGTQRLGPVRLTLWAAEDATRERATHLVDTTLDALRLPVLAQETRGAVLRLRRAPGYAATVAITLALGIGATTVVYSVVQALLLTPLPVQDPDRLVMVRRTIEGRGSFTSAPNYLDFAAQQQSFESVSAVQPWAATLTGAGEPQRIARTLVTPGFFATAGITLLHGRGFTDDEGVLGRSDVAVLGFEMWRDRFGAEPGAVGSRVVLDGVPHTIVGIAPPRLRLPPITAQVWVPLTFAPDALDARGRNNLLVVARIAEGVSREEAAAEATSIGDRLAAEHPRSNTGTALELDDLRAVAVGSARRPLWTLLAASSLLLLIAAANVATLILARGVARTREVAIHASLGASRSRLVIHNLTETLVLALLGGTLGVLLARAGLEPVRGLVPSQLASAGTVSIDLGVLAVACVATIGCGLLAGLLPALRVGRGSSNVSEGFDASLVARGSTVSRRGRALGTALVGAQFALTTVLLIGAGLLGRSLDALYRVELGLRPEGVTTFSLTFPERAYADPMKLARAVDQILAALEGPTTEAAMISKLPLTGPGLRTSMILEDGPQEHGIEAPSAGLRIASPGYRQAMGIALLRGRWLTADDGADDEPVVVINEALAQAFWPDRDPLGRWLSFRDEGDEPLRCKVVGVVADVHDRGPNLDVLPIVYQSHAQAGDVWRWFGRSISVITRSASEPPLTLSRARAAVDTVDTELPIVGLRTLTTVLDQSVAAPRFHGTLFGLFAAAGLLLSVVGLYGVTAFSVRRRRRDIGIRLALGAGRRRTITEIVLGAVGVAAIGGGIGVVTALLSSRIAASLVWGVGPRDPVVFGAVAGLLLLVAALSALLPARIAARVSPLEALASD